MGINFVGSLANKNENQIKLMGSLANQQNLVIPKYAPPDLNTSFKISQDTGNELKPDAFDSFMKKAQDAIWSVPVLNKVLPFFTGGTKEEINNKANILQQAKAIKDKQNKGEDISNYDRGILEEGRKIALENVTSVVAGAIGEEGMVVKNAGKNVVKKGAEKIISKEVIPLLEEARKYKSADEFVSKFEYHSSDNPLKEITSQNPNTSRTFSKGVFTTPDLATSQKYGKNVYSVYLGDKKILDTTTEGGMKELDNILKGTKNNWDEQVKVLKKNGYDGIKWDYSDKQGITETQLFENQKPYSLTKSQLTDIWNEENSVTKNIERGFIQSAKEAIPEAEKIAGQYIPRDTDRLAIMAKNLIKDDFLTAEKLALTGTDDKAVAVASELLKHYNEQAEKATSQAIKNAMYDKAAEVANTIAPKLTEQGRAIQAATILGRLTPEGQVKFAASQIAKYNEALPLKKRISSLTGEQTKYIIEKMRKINKMAEGMEKAKMFQELQNYISKLVPTSLFKKITTIWKAGLLTGLKTSGVNIFANLSHATTEVVKDVPATITDKIFSLFTGKRSLSFTAKGELEGAIKGAGKGWEYLKSGFDERNIGTKLDFEKVNFGKGKIAKVLQAYTDTIFRIMGTEDQPFYYAAKIRSIYEQAKVEAINKGLKGEEAQKFIENLVQNPTDQMTKYAALDAETAVFQNKTALAEAASAITRKVPATEFIIPFRRTPSAVAMQVINYTPIGIAKELASQIVKKEFNQRLMSQTIGRGLTGMSLLGLGAYLYDKGLITTARPTGEKEQKLWELEGKQANSIKIGGKWRQIPVLGPAGNVLLVGASFQKAYQDTGTISGTASQGLADSSKAFTQQTFLTGVSNFIDAVSDPMRSAQSVVGSTLASSVPTFVSDVARSTDTNERRANTIFDKFVVRIPGLRETLEPQVNVLGQEIKTMNPLEVMADPTRPINIKNSPVISELRRLWDRGYKVSPSLLGDKNGYKSLTPEQNTQLWEKAGQITNSKLEALFNNDGYKKLDDEKKAKIVDDFVGKSQNSARAEMVLQLTQDLKEGALKNKLSELKKTGLLTQSVFKLWNEIR